MLEIVYFLVHLVPRPHRRPSIRAVWGGIWSSFVNVKGKPVTNVWYRVLFRRRFQKGFPQKMSSTCVSNVAVRIQAIKCTYIQLSPGNCLK